MVVWRICRRAQQALDGDGARLHGGRWNSEGVGVIYTSSSLSLAALEMLVHLEPLIMPDDLVALQIEVPDRPHEFAYADADRLPSDWRDYPAPDWAAELGDTWIKEGDFLRLGVPSAVIPSEYNILINPAHDGMRSVRVMSSRAFSFDTRLI